MNKVFVNKETNEVMQIINIDVDDRFDEKWYPDCYLVDDEDNNLKHHGYIYNLETKEFLEMKDYIEPDANILPSETEILKEAIAERDKEILNLKLTIAESTEDRDIEILNIKAAIAEIVEGGV